MISSEGKSCNCRTEWITKRREGNCHEHVIEEQFNHKTNNEAAGRTDRHRQHAVWQSHLLPAAEQVEVQGVLSARKHPYWLYQAVHAKFHFNSENLSQQNLALPYGTSSQIWTRVRTEVNQIFFPLPPNYPRLQTLLSIRTRWAARGMAIIGHRPGPFLFFKPLLASYALWLQWRGSIEHRRKNSRRT